MAIHVGRRMWGSREGVEMMDIKLVICWWLPEVNMAMVHSDRLTWKLDPETVSSLEIFEGRQWWWYWGGGGRRKRERRSLEADGFLQSSDHFAFPWSGAGTQFKGQRLRRVPGETGFAAMVHTFEIFPSPTFRGLCDNLRGTPFKFGWIYPRVNQHSYWKLPIYSWFPYKKWWFSIVMLVYQRGNVPSWKGNLWW